MSAHEAAAFFFCLCAENGEKAIFFGKTLCTRRSKREHFFGASTYIIFIRTQDLENVIGLGDRASVLKL